MSNMPTLGASEDVLSLTSIDGLKNTFEGCWFERGLEFIEYHVEELLCILLDHHVDRLSSVVLVGETEVNRVEVTSLRVI